MLFNSFPFIAVFLPTTFILAQAARRLAGLRVELLTISAASLVFYGLWDIRYLPLLIGSIAANFWLAGRILAAATPRSAAHWLAWGVALNLAILGLFKYAHFVAATLAALAGQPPPFAALQLPLAISFITFQKIAYLVDCRRGRVAEHNALDYLFFVSFFPQLIAGPIVHHRPLIAQTQAAANPLFKDPAVPAAALFFFAAGLFKKVVLADSLARYATPVFDLAQHASPTADHAWQATLAYTLQLYFDFSGYSDMAIGLALLFGFRLPINFNSPYRATSLIEFWRRWHITLSAFLRDYLYIPLGGNRQGHYRNIALTMLLAGLWHGAGWTFIAWGAAHGALLLGNHAWRAGLNRMPRLRTAWHATPALLPAALTFACVALAWVLFRAADLGSALRIYQALLFSPPTWPGTDDLLAAFLDARPPAAWLWIALGLAVAWLVPNTAALANYDPTPNAPWRQRPGAMLGLAAAAALWISLKWMAVQPPTEFLYFQF